MLETTFYNKLANKLKKAGWFVQKIHQGRFGQGFPDVILISPEGDVIFLELKVGTNKLSALQKKKLTEIERHDGISIVGRYYDGVIFLPIYDAIFWEADRKAAIKEKSLSEQYCQTLETIWEGKKK